MTVRRDPIADADELSIVFERIQHWLELHDRAVAHRGAECWGRLSNAVSGAAKPDIGAAWSAFTRETEQREHMLYEQIADQYALALKQLRMEPLHRNGRLSDLALPLGATRERGRHAPSNLQELERAAAVYVAELEIRWKLAISELRAHLTRARARLNGSSLPGRFEDQP